MELGIKDWLDFINALDKLYVRKWAEFALLPYSATRTYHPERRTDKLAIFTLKSKNSAMGRYCIGNIETLEIGDYIGNYPRPLPPNWKEIVTVFESFAKRIREDGINNYGY